MKKQLHTYLVIDNHWLNSKKWLHYKPRFQRAALIDRKWGNVNATGLCEVNKCNT